MTPPSHTSGARRAGRPRAAAGAAALLGACLLAAGCAAGSAGTSAQGSSPVVSAPRAAGPAAMALPAGRSGDSAGAAPALAGQSIIYTAALTVRARDVGAAVSRAAGLAEAAGGYVSSETTRLGGSRHGQAGASVVLKIPVAAYPATLAALSSQLGDRLSASQRAQDVTQAVADVGSRVASARAAIAQLRRLLARAGSVGDLLSVQDQINSEESDLEALLSQQRALSRETAYATVSVSLVGPAAPPPARRPGGVHGFAGGLAVGWRALVRATSWLLTALGVALPFAVVAGALAGAGLLGRRKLARRRPGPSPAE